MNLARHIGYRSWRSTASLLAALALLMNLTACNQKVSTSTVLVKVNGDPITALQLDTELLYAGLEPEKESESDVAKSALRAHTLEVLINRKILRDEAMRKKIDRDPRVMQAIDHFKTQAIVQAWLESESAALGAPSKETIAAYFEAHPELFSHRKILDINQLSIAPEDFSVPLRLAMAEATSLEQIEAWLDKQNIAYIKSIVSYTSADMSSEVIDQLQNFDRNHLFILKEGGRRRLLLCTLNDMRDSPITAAAAAPQIERFLINQTLQEVAATEIARLRPLAKIEYVDQASKVLEDAPPQRMRLPEKTVPDKTVREPEISPRKSAKSIVAKLE
ncbi:EpsD family peptidyl-prolyl cis-trans isomerase [Glaciimonas sp. GG7]